MKIKNDDLIEITPEGEAYLEGYLDAQEKQEGDKTPED